MDKYSIPVDKTKTKLSFLFNMRVRETPEKPGRKLAIVWDSRTPLVDGFENKYTYTVTFAAIGNVAGNHYHNIKQELFYPALGKFKVILENTKTKEREEIELDSDKHQALYIPNKIAHVVIAKSNPAVFLVTASSPATDEDELTYRLT